MKISYYLPLLFLLGGCVGPDYERPNIPVPQNWKNQSAAVVSKDQRSIDITWWHNFNDAQLVSLINEASKSNLDYLTALSRVKEARATYEGVVANLFPTVNAQGSGTRYSFGPAVPNPYTGGGGSTNSDSNNQNTLFNLYNAGFDATWEIDIFGAIRRGEESAIALLESVEDNARITMLSLIAEIAQNYINLRSNQQQLEITKQIIAAWQENLNLQKNLENSGLNSQIATQTAQSALNQALSTIPPLEANVKIAIHHLSILLGKDPSGLYNQLISPKEVPYTSEAIIAGLPSELISRRPDVRMNERLLASATAQIGIATAALFPQFQLTGSYGFERGAFRRVFSPGSQEWQYGLNFSVPIFDFGKIRSQIDVKYAQRDEAFLIYKKSILTALEDVENGLINFANETNRFHKLQKQLEAQARVYRLTLDRHKAGLNSLLDVIQAKINLLNNKLNATQSKATVSLNLVTLFKALGGGWEVFENKQDSSLPN